VTTGQDVKSDIPVHFTGSSAAQVNIYLCKDPILPGFSLLRLLLYTEQTAASSDIYSWAVGWSSFKTMVLATIKCKQMSNDRGRY
jgi:hypothetical protein